MASVKKPSTFCAYCGSTEQLTDDHVPPKSIFPSPRPGNLITVRACADCHTRTSKDDEYFKNSLCMNEMTADHPDAEKNRASVLRALARPQAKGLLKSFLRDAFPINLRTPSGIYVGQSYAYNVDLARLFRVVERTVRGLFAHEMCMRLADGYDVLVHSDDSLGDQLPEHVASLQKTVLGPLLRIPSKVIGDNVFSYRFLRTNEDPFVTVWGMIFYGNIPFLAFTGPHR